MDIYSGLGELGDVPDSGSILAYNGANHISWNKYPKREREKEREVAGGKEKEKEKEEKKERMNSP